MKKYVFYMSFFLVMFGFATSLSAQTGEVRMINAAQFKQLVWNYDRNPAVRLESKLPVLVDFYATWCPPCKRLSPLVDQLQREFKGKIIIYRVDVDKDPVLSQRMGIEAMPTLIGFNRHNEKYVSVGYMDYPALRQLVMSKLLR
ncbi:MAG: thioredoxin family protein [Microbacter sp.]